MTDTAVIEIAMNTMMITAKLAAPILIVSLAIGVFVSLIQSVTQVQEYAKRDFPTDVVYSGDDRASLRLITCGGAFDRRTGRYLSNVIVFAAPV